MARPTATLAKQLSTFAKPLLTRSSTMANSSQAISSCPLIGSSSAVLGRASQKAAWSRPVSRSFASSSFTQHGDLTRPAKGTGIKVHFQDSKGNAVKTIEGNEGDDLLSLAHEWDVDLEGACERSLACSTCHVILEPQVYDNLPEPEDEENDMLDLAFGLEDTSRLGCQVFLQKELDGMVVKLPAATRNMYVDGAKARTH